jgi:hypothetical protein
MYPRIVASDTRPTEATRYDLDHSVGGRERSAGIRRAAPEE